MFAHPLRALALATLIAFTSSGASVIAKPTAEPGGANQATAVAGTLHSPSLFNGEVRIRKMTITKVRQTADEGYTDGDGQRWIVFRSLMSNGTPHSADIQQFDATISDADGVSVSAQPDKVRPPGMVSGLAPGAAWRENILFQIPADFKPVKIVLLPGDHKHKAFRIMLTEKDVPAP